MMAHGLGSLLKRLAKEIKRERNEGNKHVEK
jgi:hypothetical protein